MNSSSPQARIILSGVYFAIAFASLLIFYWPPSLCGQITRATFLLYVAGIALTITGIDVIASLLGSFILSVSADLSALALLAGPTITAAGTAYLSQWLFNGYGHYKFENIWPALHCFFEEGYGMAFAVLGAIFFAFVTFLRELLFVTFLRELLLLWLRKRHASS
jgi:hypothetical protein